MSLWVSNMSPPVDGQLVAGQEAFVTLSCTGPGGYRYYIGAAYVVAGREDPKPRWEMGSVTGYKCDFPCDGSDCSKIGWRKRYSVDANTPSVLGLRIYVWVDQGMAIQSPSPGRVPDLTKEIGLGWKAPR